MIGQSLAALAPILQQDDGFGFFAGFYVLCMSVFAFGLAILLIIGLWKTFEKAAQPGWAAIIPIYNTYILLKIAGREWWWLLLMLIPFVNIVVWLVLSLDIAKSFDKGTGFGLFIFFLNGIAFMVLGFGDAQYYGPAALKK